jgi:hypothetical protein
LNSSEWFPGDAAGLLTLDAEQFVPVDPQKQCCFHASRISTDDALSGDRARTSDPLEEADGTDTSQASSFLQQSLLKVAARNSHLPSQGDQLLGCETISALAFGGLQLGRSLDDPLERRPVDAGG